MALILRWINGNNKWGGALNAFITLIGGSLGTNDDQIIIGSDNDTTVNVL